MLVELAVLLVVITMDGVGDIVLGRDDPLTVPSSSDPEIQLAVPSGILFLIVV
jgi:hypothetical protein